MISVRKLDGTSIVLNADWIQSIESTPDTVITLTTGFKLVVKDSVDEVLQSCLQYKRQSSPLRMISGSKP